MHPFDPDDMLPPAEQIANLKARVARLEKFLETYKAWAEYARDVLPRLSILESGIADLDSMHDKALDR